MVRSGFNEPLHEPAGDFMYNPMVHDVCPECGEDYIEELEDDECLIPTNT